ncbi:MAG: carboxypeptidase regulatory-like domain-containing protein [Vicinamibacterales bacterium]
MTSLLRLGRLITVAVMTATLAAPASAQVSTFDLSGTVLDSSGAVLPGATVTLRNTKTGLIRSEVTDPQGRYHFIAVPIVGEFSLRTELASFGAEERAGLVFQANTKPVIDFTLAVATVAETTTVVGRAPILETRKSELALTVDQQKIATMPLNGRNYLDLANFANGVHGAATRGDLSINGQLGRNIDYVVDGVSNKVIEWGDASKTGLSLDIVQEFQVITSQFSAEFGHSLGGIVSAVTKSGTNDFHGTGYIYERPGRFDAKNGLTGTRTPFNQQQFGGVLSGPIVRNRTHFIGSFEGTNQDSELVVTSTIAPGVAPATLNRYQGFTKVTNRFTDNHNAQLRFNLDDNQSIGNFGGLVLPDGGTKSKRASWELQGTVTSVLGSQTVNEARVQYSQFVNESTNLAPGPRVIYTGFATYGANPGSPQDIRENRIQLNDKLSRDFGAHRTFVGFDMSHIAKTGVFNADSVGVYTFAAGTPYPYNPASPATFPTQFVQGFTDPRRPISLHRDFAPFDFAGIDRSYVNVDVFAQDDWEVRRGLTLNLGIRYERQTSSPDTNNIMPRTGFAWDIGRDGRMVVRGGYGRFYDQLFDNIPNTEDLFGITGNFSITLTPGGNPGVFPTFPNVLSSLPPGFGAALGRTVTLDLGALDPDARKTPFSDQFTIGVARELMPELALTVDYTHLRGHDLFRTVDLNGPSAFDTTTGATRTVAQADATRPYGSSSRVPGPYGITEGGFKQIRAVVSEGNGWYHGLKLNLTKRFAASHFYQVSYTLSKAENEQDDFGSAAQGADPFDFRRARASNDVPHALVINGTYILPYAISLSGILNVRSGLPVDPQAGSDLNGDGFTTDRPGNLARNSSRLPTFKTVDVSLGKTFAVRAPHELELRMDVFNLFDAFNVRQVNSVYGREVGNPVATFLTPTLVWAPRQLQFAARYRF